MDFPCTETREGAGGVIARWLRGNLRHALRAPALGRAALGLTGRIAYVNPLRIRALANLHRLGSRPVEGGRVHRVHVDAQVEFVFCPERDRRIRRRVHDLVAAGVLVQSRTVNLTVVLDLLLDADDTRVMQGDVVGLASHDAGVADATLYHRRSAG